MKLDFSERLLLMAYSLAMSLLVPLTLVHLFWRGRGQRAYWRRWDERFAVYREPGLSECLWLHAVSVGEVNAAAPLLDRLRRRYPQLPVLVTTTTPTGSERARARSGRTASAMSICLTTRPAPYGISSTSSVRASPS